MRSIDPPSKDGLTARDLIRTPSPVSHPDDTLSDVTEKFRLANLGRLSCAERIPPGSWASSRTRTFSRRMNDSSYDAATWPPIPHPRQATRLTGVGDKSICDVGRARLTCTAPCVSRR